MRIRMYPGRITKFEARKRWKEGKPFVIVPCKCRAYETSDFVNGSAYHTGWMAKYIDPYVACGFYDSFDALVNQFEYYNCNFETGYYSAFYVTLEEFIDGIFD